MRQMYLQLLLGGLEVAQRVGALLALQVRELLDLVRAACWLAGHLDHAAMREGGALSWQPLNAQGRPCATRVGRVARAQGRRNCALGLSRAACLVCSRISTQSWFISSRAVTKDFLARNSVCSVRRGSG